MERMGIMYDKRALTIKDIKKLIMKYASMMIGYKLYFSNKENYISTITINTTYEMVEMGVEYDLCELLRL